MLVVTRKLHESIMIGDDIEVVLLEIRKNDVRLGIKAPKNKQVHRREVYDEIHGREPQKVRDYKVPGQK